MDCNPKTFNETENCGECTYCVILAKYFVNTFKKTPLNALSEIDARGLNFATLILKVRFGFEGFQLFVKQGDQ